MAPIVYNENFRTPVTKSINHVESAHSKIKTQKKRKLNGDAYKFKIRK